MSTPIITHIKIDKPRKWSGEKKARYQNHTTSHQHLLTHMKTNKHNAPNSLLLTTKLSF